MSSTFSVKSTEDTYGDNVKLLKTRERVVKVGVLRGETVSNGRVYRTSTKVIRALLYVPKHVDEDEFVIDRYEDEKFSTIVYVIRPKSLRVRLCLE